MGGGSGTWAQGALKDQRNYFHSSQRYWHCYTSNLKGLEYLASESQGMTNILHSNRISKGLLTLKNHASDGKHSGGRRARRCAERGTICSRCSASLRGEPCVSLAYTEIIKCFSCPFGQREWRCRMESNSLSRGVKSENTNKQSRNRLEISSQNRSFILIQQTTIKHSKLGEKHSQKQLIARKMPSTKQSDWKLLHSHVQKGWYVRVCPIKNLEPSQ